MATLAVAGVLLLLLVASALALGLTKVIWASVREDHVQMTTAIKAWIDASCVNSSVMAYAPDELLPWAPRMRAAAATIHRELVTYEATEVGMLSPPFGALDAEQAGLVSKHECWRTMWLLMYGRETVIAEEFPQTMQLIRETSASTAMFSILDSGCSLRAHQGLNKAVLRYHLGIEVPPPLGVDGEEEKLQLRVWDGDKKHTYTWANGSDLLFDDTFYHQVDNQRSRRRVVLFIDVPREDCGAVRNWLLRAFVHVVARTKRVRHLLGEVNLWPSRMKAINQMGRMLNAPGDSKG